MRKSVQNVTRTGIAILVIQVLTSNLCMAQETDDKFSFNVSLNSDQFFGYYPFFQGAYSLSEKMDFTFYGILWSGGTGGAWGNWTEFGVGVNIDAGGGLSFNPQIGVLGGNLLSSGAAGPAVFGDGIVPNLTIGLDREKLEGQIYIGFYTPVRDEAPASGTTLSYLHYWINAGYKVSPAFSFGAHFEQLTNSGGSNVDESTDVYQWFGPYVQLSKPGGGPFSRFSFGTDFVDGNDSFFKLTAGYSF
jgi:hypothetical protein